MLNYLLFVQHGWADTNRKMLQLARTVAPPNTQIITPNLGYIRTWLRMDPLIDHVEQSALEILAYSPRIPIRIIGHSMGGLIWLEVLKRHPEWWSRVESLTLVASPIGGAHLARAVDPLNIGIGVARDLAVNRRRLAESIASVIPTLVIAGNIDQGSDGTITIESTKFRCARFEVLDGLDHEELRDAPAVAALIREFWSIQPFDTPARNETVHAVVQRLRDVPGITDAHENDFQHTRSILRFRDGTTIRTGKNWFGLDHVFVADREGRSLYGGFVGWLHSRALRKELAAIRNDFQAEVSEQSEWLGEMR